MVTKITNLFKKKSVNLGTPFMFWGGYSSRLDLNEIDVAFKDWTFACIKRRSTSLASLNWYGATKKADGTNAPLDKNHWLSMLLEKPNPYMTFSEMIEFHARNSFFSLAPPTPPNITKFFNPLPVFRDRL